MSSSSVDRLLRAVSLALEREDELRAVPESQNRSAIIAERERLLRATRRALRAWTSGDLCVLSAAELVESALDDGAAGGNAQP